MRIAFVNAIGLNFEPDDFRSWCSHCPALVLPVCRSALAGGRRRRDSAACWIGNLGQCYIRSGSQYLLHFQQRNLAKVNSRTLSMSSQWKAQLKFHVSAGHRAYQLGTYDFLLRLVTETLHLNFVNDGVLLRAHELKTRDTRAGSEQPAVHFNDERRLLDQGRKMRRCNIQANATLKLREMSSRTRTKVHAVRS